MDGQDDKEDECDLERVEGIVLTMVTASGLNGDVEKPTPDVADGECMFKWALKNLCKVSLGHNKVWL